MESRMSLSEGTGSDGQRKGNFLVSRLIIPDFLDCFFFFFSLFRTRRLALVNPSFRRLYFFQHMCLSELIFMRFGSAYSACER